MTTVVTSSRVEETSAPPAWPTFEAALVGRELVADRTMAAQRLHLVAVWREAPVFSSRERAALAWTEALTLLSETGAPDDIYAEGAREFGPEEQVALTLAIVAINGWNRLAVGFRQPVGGYVSHSHAVPA